MVNFSATLIDWQKQHGRHQLPWQQRHHPYCTWLSEIMLQQTQVDTVIPYFNRFMAAFPTIQALAQAPLDQVLSLWSGLGYYARARNLHKTAILIEHDYDGKFPTTVETLQRLPGIGRSTAAAIVALAFDTPAAILDGNVRRVLCRYFAIEGDPRSPAIEKKLWAQAEALLPTAEAATYTQAQMDLGAMICTRRQPKCHNCPLQNTCLAYRQQRVHSLPSPRAKRERPLKTQYLLLVHTTTAVLLQKRTDQGIWGGLWSLPQFDSVQLRDNAIAAIREYSITTTLPPLRHELTHFSLRLHTTQVTIETTTLWHNEAQQRWINWPELSNTGLPAPIRTLLTQLGSTLDHAMLS